MKKRVVRRSSVKAKKVISKSSNNTRAYVALGIAVFLIFVLALGFVGVSSGTGQAVKNTGGTSFISSLFSDWNKGQLDVNIAKYAFWIILTLLIFSALNFAKVPDSTFIQFILSVIVGFLFTAYITPEELFTVLTTYTAAGLALSVIIPFFVLLFVSSMLLSSEKIRHMSVGRIVGEVALWLLFIGFLGYKLATGYDGVLLSTGASIVMFAVIGISLLILVFNKQFRTWIRGLGIEIRGAKAEAEFTERRISHQMGREADRNLSE